MQKSTVTPEEKAISGSASGQDWKPGFKPGADGWFDHIWPGQHLKKTWLSHFGLAVSSDVHSCGIQCSNTISHQVHDIEFMQIEIRVIEGLKVGNECLKSMHEVGAFLHFVLRNIPISHPPLMHLWVQLWDGKKMCPDKHNFFHLNLRLPLKQQHQFVVCVSIAVAHCLKIKGLSSKALTTAAWLPLRSSAGVWKFTGQPNKKRNLCTPNSSSGWVSLLQLSVSRSS